MPVKKPKVPRTRNAGTMTESAYFSFLRSSLRRSFRYWKPMMMAKQAARKPYSGPNKLQKWQYQCRACMEWFADKQVQIDHIEPVGSLKCLADLPGFVERLTREEGYQILCDKCHGEKTALERANRK